VENDSQPECCCPGAAICRSSPTSYVPTMSTFGSGSPVSSTRPSTDSEPRAPPTVHLHSGGDDAPTAPRPMHIIRVPSYDPPAFDADAPPPPLETPPPQYDSIASPTTGLEDYFARLSDAYTAADEVVEEEEGTATPRARNSLVLQDVSVSGDGPGLAAAAPHAPVGNWL